MGTDAELIAALRAGDEDAFMRLVEANHQAMLRVARMYVSSVSVAEEVVQEAWLGVLQGIPGFEGRSSLRTWMFRIVANIAKTRGAREARSVPFSSLAGDDPSEPAVDTDRFFPPGDERAGAWSSLPSDWRGLPAERLEAGDTIRVIRETLDMLPPLQAEVLRLRDALGWSSEEVRNALEISETNQRVLLHRARSKVRAALEKYLTEVA
jgi:RNA polymerase sigma-70 factor (ECF subfamily)